MIKSFKSYLIKINILINTLQIVLTIFCILSLCFSTYSLIWVIKLKKLRRKLLEKSPPLSLEEALNSLETHLTVLERNQLSTQEQIDIVEKILQGAIQKVGIVKFNSLSNDGGNFSFSAALLNHHNSGIILSSLYGREFNRIYIKSIQNGHSEIPLTEEEEKALAETQVRKKIIN